MGEEHQLEEFLTGITFMAIGRRRCIVAAAGLLVLAQFAVAALAPAHGKPISATLVQDLDFGSFVVTSPTGTVTIYPSGAGPLYSGVLSTGGAVLPAQFEIKGDKNQPFTIILPSAPIIIPGPTGNMVIDNFFSEPLEGANGTFNGQGKATVTIGATMTVTDQLSAGPYGSTFDLTVMY